MWDADIAAERGATFLDEHDPSWGDKVDITRLDLGDCQACVLGQIYGYYARAVKLFGLSLDGETRLGFNVTYDMLARAADGDEAPKNGAFDELTAAWREQIARRRLARAGQITREVVTA